MPKKGSTLPRKGAKEYFAKEFSFGGELKTRGEIIDELRRIGGTPEMIDRYLQGLDLSSHIDEKMVANAE